MATEAEIDDEEFYDEFDPETEALLYSRIHHQESIDEEVSIVLLQTDSGICSPKGSRSPSPLEEEKSRLQTILTTPKAHGLSSSSSSDDDNGIKIEYKHMKGLKESHITQKKNLRAYTQKWKQSNSSSDSSSSSDIEEENKDLNIILNIDDIVIVIFKKPLSRCSNCREKGHSVRVCPSPRKQIKCSMCGGQHRETRCDQSMCLRCGEANRIYTRGCNRCIRFDKFRCSVCCCFGHETKACPNVWRRFHLTTNVGDFVRVEKFVDPKDKWCPNCAKKGHYLHQCPAYLVSPYPASIGHVVEYSLENVQESNNTNTKNLSKRQAFKRNKSLALKRKFFSKKVKKDDNNLNRQILSSLITQAKNKEKRVKRLKKLEPYLNAFGASSFRPWVSRDLDLISSHLFTIRYIKTNMEFLILCLLISSASFAQLCQAEIQSSHPEVAIMMVKDFVQIFRNSEQEYQEDNNNKSPPSTTSEITSTPPLSRMHNRKGFIDPHHFPFMWYVNPEFLRRYGKRNNNLDHLARLGH
ncbi:AIR1_2 [Lepeophtheirus salmonis]|uniref:Zinc finger CCHC domain-containing protein 7 n=1 Tax=Lepeophtheirus salmonis TaxID=72036 RepID=A0A7R8H6N7_LEPSM|nr:AIR1_2 [Lepeophtheirus salmonis]CAF2905209.1 AIR1_2 [Lepeophtheirus salmonis]